MQISSNSEKNVAVGADVRREQASRPMTLNAKWKRPVNTALIIGPMTMIMAFVGVVRNVGFQHGWLLKCAITWLTMFPIAYACAFFIIPVANKMTSKIKFDE